MHLPEINPKLLTVPRLEQAVLAPSRQQLQERYESAWKQIGSVGYMASCICPIFGSHQAASANVPFEFGLERKGDDAIVAQVLNQLVQKRGLEPVRILELACGWSYGAGKNYGAPLLSRTISKAFGNLVDIWVSDLDASHFQLLVRDPSLTLHSMWSDAFPAKPVVPFSESYTELNSQQLKFREITWKGLIEEHPEFASALRKNSRLSHKPPTSGQPFDEESLALFFRPALDEVFEREVFGLKAIRGVHYSNLRQFFPEKHFDLVFARHLPGYMSIFQQKVLRSADEVLNLSGVAIVNIDRG